MKKFFLFFIISLSLLLSFCSSSKKETSSPTLTLPVTVFKVPEPKSSPVELLYPGKTKSTSKVTVTARVTGFLEKNVF